MSQTIERATELINLAIDAKADTVTIDVNGKEHRVHVVDAVIAVNYLRDGDTLAVVSINFE